MEIRLDAKTLAIGVLLGAVITIALGINSVRDRATGRLLDTSSLSGTADKADFGLSVGGDGLALVRVQNGDFFVVNPRTGMAARVLRARKLGDDPTRNRDSRGKPFNFIAVGPEEEDEGGYNR